METDIKINLVNLGTERDRLQIEKMTDITLIPREYPTTLTGIDFPVTGIHSKTVPVTTGIDIPVTGINTKIVPVEMIFLILIQVLSSKDVKFQVMIKLI